MADSVPAVFDAPLRGQVAVKLESTKSKHPQLLSARGGLSTCRPNRLEVEERFVEDTEQNPCLIRWSVLLR